MKASRERNNIVLEAESPEDSKLLYELWDQGADVGAVARQPNGYLDVSISCSSRQRWMRKTIGQRFWEKVGDHSQPDTCWVWEGNSTKNRKGDRYGQFKVDGKGVLAHRFAYELLIGPIPKGYTIDHVKERGCTNTLCVNPSHLEAVTSRVNNLRGGSKSALNAKKTSCLRGHPFDEANTYIWHSARHCRACRRQQR